jgi:hypothetical protein
MNKELWYDLCRVNAESHEAFYARYRKVLADLCRQQIPVLHHAIMSQEIAHHNVSHVIGVLMASGFALDGRDQQQGGETGLALLKKHRHHAEQMLDFIEQLGHHLKHSNHLKRQWIVSHLNEQQRKDIASQLELCRHALAVPYPRLLLSTTLSGYNNSKDGEKITVYHNVMARGLPSDAAEGLLVFKNPAIDIEKVRTLLTEKGVEVIDVLLVACRDARCDELVKQYGLVDYNENYTTV